MMYHYWMLLGVGAFLFTVLSFSKNAIDDLGKIFFMYIAAICWILFAYGVQSIHYYWGGSLSVVDYTFNPVNGEEYLGLIPGVIGILMLFIGFYRTIYIFSYKPLVEEYQVAVKADDILNSMR